MCQDNYLDKMIEADATFEALLKLMPKGLYFVQLINKEVNIVRKVIIQ